MVDDHCIDDSCLDLQLSVIYNGNIFNEPSSYYREALIHHYAVVFNMSPFYRIIRYGIHLFGKSFCYHV